MTATPEGLGFPPDFVRGAEAFGEATRKLWQASQEAMSESDPARRAQRFVAAMQGLQPQLVASWMQGPWQASAWGAQAPMSSPAMTPASLLVSQNAALGLTREHQLALERLQQRALEHAAAQAEIARQWQNMLQHAFREFGARSAAAMSSGSAPPPTPRALYDLWIECAEVAYSHAAHSPEWIAAQAALANALSQLRLEQRALVEGWARQLDLPTRTELDAVHRRVRALQEELERLQARSSSRAQPS